MPLFTWLQQRRTGRPQTQRSAARKPTARYRPQLEALEDRWMPSTLAVLNNLDSGAGSLRGDIAAAKRKDTIVFAPSLNGQTITLTSGQLVINKSLTIQGPGAGQVTISGGHSSRIFEVANKTNVTLRGLTISNGTAAEGAGIYVDYGGTLTINNSTLSSNSATVYGGAIDSSGTLTISNSTLSGNTAAYAGGAIENAGANLTISGCRLSGNSVGYGSYGGAIRNDNGGNLSISNSTLSDNSAPGGYGGAIFSLGGSTLTLTDCTLSSNTAYDGGALYNMGATTVSGCTLSSNIANDTGGAIYNYLNQVLTVNNSVFSTNTPNNIFGNYSGSGNTFK
jgi:predicted outer membrane repeat protein